MRHSISHHSVSKVTPSTLFRAWRLEAARIILTGNPAPVILGTGSLLILYGFWMMLPFDSFLASPSYAYLRSLPIGELGYGAIFLSVGLAKWGLLAYNALPELCSETFAVSHRTLFTAGLLNFCMSVIWFNLTLGVAMANYRAFGWLVYLALALASLWAALRRFRQSRGGL